MKFNLNKTIAALLIQVNGWAILVWNSPAKAITHTEWGMLTTGLLTTLGVYGIANKPIPEPPAPAIDQAAALAAAHAVTADAPVEPSAP